MTVALLDIVDSNLQLWNGSKHLQSPGYALLESKQYRFGNPARAAARLRPRDINTRYWWQLSTEPLQPALGPARHTGDLVHAQLQELHGEGGQPGEILLAVSGSQQREQLALLLGIVQQCPFDAVGLVNRSVALASLYAGPGRLFHLEIQLHQAVIAELAESGGQIELQRTAPLPGCGLLQLQEKLVEIIAAAFIRQTRFDPRRQAATEQQLYDALPDTLRTLSEESETNLEINGYQARISQSELLTAGQRLFDSAADIIGTLRPEDRVIADPLAGLLPGLGQHFPQLEVLANGSMRDALEQHQERLVQREQALNFVTALPCLSEQITPRAPAAAEPAPEPAPEPAAPQPATPQPAAPQPATPQPAAPSPVTPSGAAPTHLLTDARARPLSVAGTALERGWEILQTDAGWQLRGDGPEPRVNGSRYRSDQTLHCGDRIRIGEGPETLLIEVAR